MYSRGKANISNDKELVDVELRILEIVEVIL
jgi:hypothetical protein